MKHTPASAIEEDKAGFDKIERYVYLCEDQVENLSAQKIKYTQHCPTIRIRRHEISASKKYFIESCPSIEKLIASATLNGQKKTVPKVTNPALKCTPLLDPDSFTRHELNVLHNDTGKCAIYNSACKALNILFGSNPEGSALPGQLKANPKEVNDRLTEVYKENFPKQDVPTTSAGTPAHN